MKRNVAPFGNDVVRLRLIEERDLETTLSWRNRDEARIWFKTAGLIPLDQHRAWYQSYLKKDDDFLFIIEANNKLVGQASVYGIDWNSLRAEIGRFLVAPGESGKGYINQACGQLVRFCTETLGVTYLFLEVFEDNEKAIRIYKRNGFVEEQRYAGLIRMGRSFVQLGTRTGHP